MTGKTNHCAPHLRTGHKTVRRNICHDIRLSIILNRQRQSSVILCSRSHLHPVCHFFLNHHSNRLHRNVTLKKPHNNRSRNVIRQICHYFDRFPLIFFPRQLCDIHFQDILIDHCHVVIILQCILQNRNQAFINFHCADFPRRACQILRHSTDPRSYL